MGSDSLNLILLFIKETPSFYVKIVISFATRRKTV